MTGPEADSGRRVQLLHRLSQAYSRAGLHGRARILDTVEVELGIKRNSAVQMLRRARRERPASTQRINRDLAAAGGSLKGFKQHLETCLDTMEEQGAKVRIPKAPYGRGRIFMPRLT